MEEEGFFVIEFVILYKNLLLIKGKYYSAYSIIKGSNEDSGVIFKFLQNPPIVKAALKFQKNVLQILQYFDISERK